MRLEGKTALITGGGTGIGAAVAGAFAREGCQVAITGRREEKLAAVAVAIEAPHKVQLRAADVAERNQVDQLVNWCRESLGRVDILVNNAGVNVAQRRLEELSLEDWDTMMNINATAAFNLVHALLPSMRRRRDGVIISVSSIAGLRPSVLGGAAYSASKHAMTALTRVIGLEEREKGIRACVISPGEVETPILQDRPEPVSDEHRLRILQPEDVAAAVLFVATLHPRASVPELIIKPTTQAFA